MEPQPVDFAVSYEEHEELVWEALDRFQELVEWKHRRNRKPLLLKGARQVGICCAGFHIGLSMGNASFPVGKVDILTLYPMTFREFLKAQQKKLVEMIDAPPPIPEAFHNRLREALKTSYFTGGMPEVVQTYLNHQPVSHETFLRVRETQTRLIQGYRADFAKHSGKTNAALFDVGLLGCMADIPIQTILSQDFGSYKGSIAENYVAQKLQSSGFTELYSWKGKTSEIEFLVVINGKIIPLEVKSGSRMNPRFDTSKS